MRRKIGKAILFLVILIIASFGFYAYKLRSIANEGNNLFEQRCLNVNPHLIGYKNYFLDYADVLNHPQNLDIERGAKALDNYLIEMRTYLEAENNWLESDSAYISRWDFRLFMPWYIKQAAEYQIEMYKGYRDDAKYMLELVDAGGYTEEIGNKIYDAKDRRDKYSELYSNFGNNMSKAFDLRNYIIFIPTPKGCTKENMVIPNTFNSINWSGETKPTPLPIPPSIDPNLVS